MYFVNSSHYACQYACLLFVNVMCTLKCMREKELNPQC